MSGSTIWGFDAATLQAFDAAYWASQPPAVRALQNANKGIDSTGNAPAAMLAQQLMGQGYLIDVPIMVWGWDPYATMYVREFVDGFTGVPGAGLAAGGVSTPAVPAGYIKVSTNIADYPAYDPPPAPTPQVSPVGGWLGMTANMLSGSAPALPAGVNPATVKVYAGVSGFSFPEGYQYMQSEATKAAPAGTYQYHMLGSDLMSVDQRIGVWLLLP